MRSRDRVRWVRRTASMLVALLALALVGGACGDGGSPEGGEPSSTLTVGPDTTFPGPQGSMGTVVAMLPADALESAGTVELGSLQRFTAQTGIVVTADRSWSGQLGPDVDEPLDLAQSQLDVTGQGPPADRFGIDPADVDGVAVVGAADLSTLTTFSGEVDPEAVAEALAAAPTIAPTLGTEEVAGVTVHTWTEESPDPELVVSGQTPPTDHRLYVTDTGGIYGVGGAETFAAAVAVVAGGAPSLFDDDAVSAAVSALDASDAYRALLLEPGPPAAADAEPTLASAAAIGLGATRPSGQPAAVLVVAAADEADAATDAAALQELLAGGTSTVDGRAYTSLLTVGGVESEGAVVAVEVTAGDAGGGVGGGAGVGAGTPYGELVALALGRDALFSRAA